MANLHISEILESISAGYRAPDDELFSGANKKLLPTFKKLGVINNEDDLLTERVDTTKFYCNVSGCQLVFEGVAAYQTHFNNAHRYICAECRRSLPTAHLLDLHISERHDSYFAARVERGEAMYACLLEECKQLMNTQEQRKEHCISVHKFPANYRFDQISEKATNTRNEDKKSGAHGLKSGQSFQDENPTQSQQPTIIMNDKDARKMKQFCFGHNKDRAFPSKKKAGDTLNDMQELQHALEELTE